jgi:O-antigen/teichoic acid export membrane protein
MALVNCPSCSKKISDKTPSCEHCGLSLGTAVAEDIARKQSLNKYLKSQSVQMQSMLAMLIFVAGFGFMYWGGAKPGGLQYNIAIGLTLVGFVWYIVNRVRLVFLKRSD